MTAIFILKQSNKLNKLILSIQHPVKYLTAFISRQSYNPVMVVCQNCFHKRTFHKKVDGNMMCSVKFCACKQFVEVEVPFNRRKLHEEIDRLLNEALDFKPPEDN